MSAAPRVLLTVSGTIPADLDDAVAAGRRPRADYRVIATRLRADVADRAVALAACGRIGRLIERFGGVGPLLAWYAFRNRRRYDVLLTDGEQVGLPLALLARVLGRGAARHVMIVHVMSVAKKARLVRWTRIAGMIDTYLVYASAQAEYLAGHLGVAPERVVRLPFMVDPDFFDPAVAPSERRRMICSAGLERRDYTTLMRAVEGLDADVVIAAASPWSKWADSSQGAVPPSNVTIERLDLFDLRALYAASTLVVVPLEPVDFQAGITTILEAMAMRRTVVCSRAPGQTDTIVDGETGVYVPPGDAVALRATLERLLDDPAELERIGGNAREWVVAHAAVDRYAEQIADVLADVLADVV